MYKIYIPVIFGFLGLLFGLIGTYRISKYCGTDMETKKYRFVFGTLVTLIITLFMTIFGALLGAFIAEKID
ncbi:membrane protein [Acanthamoeba polyphaga mimivirus]|uniref:Membrane protein n=1 Tax=Acanthamoeba polyphaga mimivirus TaxID=212035 RepID=A0A2L2DKM4_MIMIV|nr:membrane protein [Acanthamoeba polyphaga mimivirus]